VRVVTIALAGLALSVGLYVDARASAPQAAPQASSKRQMIDRYCVTCHNQKLKTAGLMLDKADVASPGAAGEIWEKVVRKLHTSTC